MSIEKHWGNGFWSPKSVPPPPLRKRGRCAVTKFLSEFCYRASTSFLEAVLGNDSYGSVFLVCLKIVCLKKILKKRNPFPCRRALNAQKDFGSGFIEGEQGNPPTDLFLISRIDFPNKFRENLCADINSARNLYPRNGLLFGKGLGENAFGGPKAVFPKLN
ncbi:MAG: hypothetical protein A2007_05770 [Verrucomicrobia bacterium GWC2_42_7]|nr:MAG: hypothetical protein A2007_05770 [Verrucomicrobia bacterium GWC2_42_7]